MSMTSSEEGLAASQLRYFLVLWPVMWEQLLLLADSLMLHIAFCCFLSC